MNSLIVLCAGILGTAAAPQAETQSLDKTACAACRPTNTTYAPPNRSYQTNYRPSGYRLTNSRLPVAQNVPGRYSGEYCPNGQCDLRSRCGTTGYTASNPYSATNGSGYSTGTEYCPNGQCNLSSRYGTTGNNSGFNGSLYGSQFDSRYDSRYDVGYGSQYPSRYNSSLDSRYPSNANYHTRYNLDSSNRYHEGYNTRDRYPVDNYRTNQPYLSQSPRSPYFN